MGKAGRPPGSRRIDKECFYSLFRSVQKGLTHDGAGGVRDLPTQEEIWWGINKQIQSDDEFAQALSWRSFNRYLADDPRLKPRRPMRIPDRREEAM